MHSAAPHPTPYTPSSPPLGIWGSGGREGRRMPLPHMQGGESHAPLYTPLALMNFRGGRVLCFGNREGHCTGFARAPRLQSWGRCLTPRTYAPTNAYAPLCRPFASLPAATTPIRMSWPSGYDIALGPFGCQFEPCRAAPSWCGLRRCLELLG